MTTKTLSALETESKLEQERDARFTALQDAKRKRNAFKAETEELRTAASIHHQTHPEEYADAAGNPKPGTDAAKMRTKIRGRMAKNPHVEEFESAQASFHEADNELQQFRLKRIHDRLAGPQEAGDEALSELREAYETVVRCCDRYRAAQEAARTLVVSTPSLNAQHLAHANVDALRAQAADALDGLADPIHIGLTEIGEWEVEQHGG